MVNFIYLYMKQITFIGKREITWIWNCWRNTILGCKVEQSQTFSLGEILEFHHILYFFFSLIDKTKLRENKGLN